MRIIDAKPGDVLQDAEGALWLVGKTHARCIHDPSGSCPTGDAESFGYLPTVMVEAEGFGPFVRLVPEKDPTDAV